MGERCVWCGVVGQNESSRANESGLSGTCVVWSETSQRAEAAQAAAPATPAAATTPACERIHINFRLQQRGGLLIRRTAFGGTGLASTLYLLGTYWTGPEQDLEPEANQRFGRLSLSLLLLPPSLQFLAADALLLPPSNRRGDGIVRAKQAPLNEARCSAQDSPGEKWKCPPVIACPYSVL